jgi:hypothetical protein
VVHDERRVRHRHMGQTSPLLEADVLPELRLEYASIRGRRQGIQRDDRLQSAAVAAAGGARVLPFLEDHRKPQCHAEDGEAGDDPARGLPVTAVPHRREEDDMMLIKLAKAVMDVHYGKMSFLADYPPLDLLMHRRTFHIHEGSHEVGFGALLND